MAKKAGNMQPELSNAGNGHAAPVETVEQRLDRCLGNLYDEILAEPLSQALATLVARLRNHTLA
ncbi:MAG: hypothetical protein SGJ07_10275 [Rhodospirillaceae bacterium]|nr:hypothetical protein [Rhodospirillaceae bacterium]